MENCTKNEAKPIESLGRTFERAIGVLEQDFQAWLRELPALFVEASDRLVTRIGIGSDQEQRIWTKRFSPLTLLYPQLQVECLDPIDDSLMREANLAHLAFLIHAFIEDRMLDGQIALDRAETLFSKELFSLGLCTAQRIENRMTENESWTERLLRAYCLAQASSYRPTKRGATPRLTYATIRRVAAGRGYLGAIVALALTTAAGCDLRRQRITKNAFDALMLGLQWADDLTDWREDLASNDINLALESLRETGPDPYAHPADERRRANVGHALVESGTFASGFKQARRWFEYAARRQRELGCSTLAALIDKHAGALQHTEAKLLSNIQDDVLEYTLVDTARRAAFPAGSTVPVENR